LLFLFLLTEAKKLELKIDIKFQGRAASEAKSEPRRVAEADHLQPDRGRIRGQKAPLQIS
jgi:hypothetical protein